MTKAKPDDQPEDTPKGETGETDDRKPDGNVEAGTGETDDRKPGENLKGKTGKNAANKPNGSTANDEYLKVIAPKQGRWRIGRHFTKEPTILKASDLTEFEIAALEDDALLNVTRESEMKK